MHDPKTLAGLLLTCALSASSPSPAQDAAPFPDDPQAIVHLLNRIGFGPRPGDVERVRALGVHEYVLAQLNPESVPDPVVETRLQRFATLELETSEIAAMVREAMQRRKAEAPLDSAAARGETAPDNAAARRERAAVRLPLLELAAARLERAIYSERQLEEVMVDFWLNHFNVFAGKGADRVLLTSYERDAVRPHALGRFEDLLQATAHHPAMLFYLDNWLSVAPGAEPPRGLRGKPIPSGINENYARELLELHTLGVDGGYTQADVIAVARAFTGWSIDRPRQGGEFVYHDWAHDRESKTVLGQSLPAGGKSEGEAVLHLLATHPATARFVSTKLAQRFVADEPPEALVARMAETWRLTDGDIREVLHTLLESEEFWDPARFGAKVKTPFEMLVSAVRALEADVGPAPVLKALRAMNHVPYGAEAPTGYPEVASAWLDAGTLDQRVQVAQAIAERISPRALATDPSMTDPRLEERAEEVGRAILARLFPAGSSPELAAAVQRAAEESPSQALALALASPDFQKQ